MSRGVRGPSTPPVRSTNPPPAQAPTNRTTTSTTNAASQPPATNRLHELAQTAQLVRARLTTAVANAAAAQTIDPQVQAAANQVRQAYGNPQGQTYPMNAARELARQLQTGTPQFRQQLMAELAQDPRVFADIMRAAGGDPFQNTGNVRDRTTPITDAERQIIAQAFGSAYSPDAGPITKATVAQLVGAELLFNGRMGSANGDFVGLLVAQSGSNNLMCDYATAVLEFVRDAPTPHAERMINSAARAMAGSPEVLNDMIGRLRNGDFAGPGVNTPITLSGFIERLSGYQVPGFDMPVSGTRTTALGDILTTAAQANFDTKLALFEQTINHGRLDQLTEFNAGGTVLEALTNLYRSDARKITDHFIIPRDNSLHGLVLMSRFFRRTMFNDLLSDNAKDGLVQTLSDLADQYRNENRGNQLGRLIGTITNGFTLTVREQRDRERAISDLVKLAIGLVPGVGQLKEIFGSVFGKELGNLLTGRTVEEAQKILTRELVNRLTVGSGGILGVGAWADVTSANDIDRILKELFDVGSLPDPRPDTADVNEAVTDDVQDGIETADYALRNDAIRR